MATPEFTFGCLDNCSIDIRLSVTILVAEKKHFLKIIIDFCKLQSLRYTYETRCSFYISSEFTQLWLPSCLWACRHPEVNLLRPRARCCDFECAMDVGARLLNDCGMKNTISERARSTRPSILPQWVYVWATVNKTSSDSDPCWCPEPAVAARNEKLSAMPWLFWCLV